MIDSMNENKLHPHPDNCTGCGVCSCVCPTKAVSLSKDQEGFWFPKIDKILCKECGICEKSCHMRQVIKSHNFSDYKEFVFAAYSKNTEFLKTASSGGVFGVLAEHIIKKGGCVYGAIQTDIFSVEHRCASTSEELGKMKKSKYLQSSTSDVFESVEKNLKNNRNVFFSGTACQIAALLTYLRKDYENLLTCDVVCHGVPSNELFRQYIKELEKKYKSNAVNIVFRDKSKGWNNNHITISFENGKIISEKSNEQFFHKAYLMGLSCRVSCGTCPYATVPRLSDITLADFWKYDGRIRAENNNHGISLVVCNTIAGTQVFEEITSELTVDKVTLEEALASCRHLGNKPLEHPNRKMFFREAKQNSCIATLKKYTKSPLSIRLVGGVKKCVKLILS